MRLRKQKKVVAVTLATAIAVSTISQRFCREL